MSQTEIDSTETYQPVHYAGFWIRVAAAIIDSLTVFAVSSSVRSILLGLTLNIEFYPQDRFSVTYKAIILFTSVILPIFYECYFLASPWMGTPGMKLLRIKVIDYDGNRISFGRSFVRYLSQILSALIFGIGYIMIAFDRRKQGLHDKLAKTLVIYRQ